MTPRAVPGWLRQWRPIDYPRRTRDLPAPQPPPPPREPLRRAAEILRRGAADRRQLKEAATSQIGRR